MPVNTAQFDTWMSLACILCCLVFLGCLSNGAKAFPSMLRCLFRARESEILESSVRLARSRNAAAFGIMLPFVFSLTLHGLNPFLGAFSPIAAFGLGCAVFAGYCLLRWLCCILFRDKQISDRDWECGKGVAYTYFTLMGLAVTATGLVCSFFLVSGETARNVIKWEIIAIYGLCLIRKTQIFSGYRGFFKGFLYLCTLEILPTFLLVFFAGRIVIWL